MRFTKKVLTFDFVGLLIQGVEGHCVRLDGLTQAAQFDHKFHTKGIIWGEKVSKTSAAMPRRLGVVCVNRYSSESFTGWSCPANRHHRARFPQTRLGV
jgi:hypothetical protein